MVVSQVILKYADFLKMYTQYLNGAVNEWMSVALHVVVCLSFAASGYEQALSTVNDLRRNSAFQGSV